MTQPTPQEQQQYWQQYAANNVKQDINWTPGGWIPNPFGPPVYIPPVPVTPQTPVIGGASGAINGVDNFFSAIAPLTDWLSNPGRIAKFVIGAAILVLAAVAALAFSKPVQNAVSTAKSVPGKVAAVGEVFA